PGTRRRVRRHGLEGHPSLHSHPRAHPPTEGFPVRLFRKTWKVVLAGRPRGFAAENANFFESIGNAVEITEMRVGFSVSKSLSKEPNKCTITLYNLAEHTRMMLDQHPV